MKLKRWEILVQYRDHPDNAEPDYEQPYTNQYLTRRGAEHRAAQWRLDKKIGLTCVVRRRP